MGITNHKSTLADSSERMDGDIEELFRDTLAREEGFEGCWKAMIA